MTTRRTHHNAPASAPGSRKTFVNIGKASLVPPSLTDGQARCPVCRNATTPTPRGLLRKHRDLFGEPCFNKSTGEATGVTAPPVILPADRAPVAEPSHNVAERIQRPKGASRLDVGSECVACGKWLPGERSLCGRCYVRRER